MITQSDIQGHWARRWLRAPGFEDSSTQVHWMQSGAFYADVRIPRDRPDLSGATCLADLSPDALRLLLEAEGFAGTTDVRDGICTWHRAINWHGATDQVDAGRLSFDAAGDLIEDGVHAEYAELWTRPETIPNMAQRLHGDAWEAYFLNVGPNFVFGLGRRDALSSKGLIDALTEGAVPAGALQNQFQRTHIFGIWDGGSGQARAATNPFLEGRTCLRQIEAGLVYHHIEFDGAARDILLVSGGSGL